MWRRNKITISKNYVPSSDRRLSLRIYFKVQFKTYVINLLNKYLFLHFKNNFSEKAFPKIIMLSQKVMPFMRRNTCVVGRTNYLNKWILINHGVATNAPTRFCVGQGFILSHQITGCNQCKYSQCTWKKGKAFMTNK